MPTVSIIIPNYNHARFLRQRIESVLGQTYQDFELILLDDCSTDESRLILAEYADHPRVQIHINEINSGNTFKQWNKGVRLAEGEFVWIAESDDYADKKLLERLIAALTAEPNISIAYCRSWRVSEESELDGLADSYLDPVRWASDYSADGRQECQDYFMLYNIIPNASAALCRKSLYERVGGADERLRLCGDWKLWASIALHGKVSYLSEPMNYFRFHTSTVRGKGGLRLYALESLQVSQWIASQVDPTTSARERMCLQQAKYWVPALLSLHVPMEVKRQIWREVRAVDPRPIRHAIRPALDTLRMKIARHSPLVKS